MPRRSACVRVMAIAGAWRVDSEIAESSPCTNNWSAPRGVEYRIALAYLFVIPNGMRFAPCTAARRLATSFLPSRFREASRSWRVWRSARVAARRSMRSGRRRARRLIRSGWTPDRAGGRPTPTTYPSCFRRVLPIPQPARRDEHVHHSGEYCIGSRTLVVGYGLGVEDARSAKAPGDAPRSRYEVCGGGR